MAIDSKYGRVTTEHGTIGDDEPVFIFRAQDALLPEVLDHYLDLCRDADAPVKHIGGIIDARAKVVRWQAQHHIQIPQSNTLIP